MQGTVTRRYNPFQRLIYTACVSGGRQVVPRRAAAAIVTSAPTRGNRLLPITNSAIDFFMRTSSCSCSSSHSPLSWQSLSCRTFSTDRVPTVRASNENHRQNITHSLVKEIKNAKSSKEALAVLQRMNDLNIEIQRIHYTTAISTCGKNNDWHAVMDLLREMEGEKGIQATVVTYNAVLDAYAKTGMWKKAMKLLQNMPLQGIQPDARSYQAVLYAFKVAGKGKEALWLLEEMKKTGSHPTKYLFSMAIQACERNWELALEILQKQKDSFDKPEHAFCEYCFTSCISVCGKAGQWEKALQLLNELIHHPDASVVPTIFCFNAAIIACQNCGQWDEAVRVFELAKKFGLAQNPYLYSTIMSAGARAGKTEEVISMLQELKDNGGKPEMRHYGLAMRVCSISGRWETALDLMEDMRSAHIRPDKPCYYAAMEACVKGGQSVKALDLFEETLLSKIHTSPARYLAAIQMCGKLGELDRAMRFYKQMVSAGLSRYDCFKGGQITLANYFFANQFAAALALVNDVCGHMTPRYEKGDILWDLQPLSLVSVAPCFMLVSKILLDTSLEHRQGLQESCDIVFITGEKIHEYQETKSTLNTLLRQFLDEHSGPSLLDRDDCRSCVITKSHLEQWLDSDKFAHFQSLIKGSKSINASTASS
eukprot:scaffold34709_cov189-Amphora_coffeaeformis.AAC.1